MRTTTGCRTLALLAASIVVACKLVPSSQTIIRIDADKTYQTMTGWESTSYAYQQSPAFVNFIAQVLDGAVNEVGINRVRLEIRSGVENAQDNWQLFTSGQIDNATWRCVRYATVNDNDDPNTTNPQGFYFSELDWTVENIILPMKNRLEANGEKLHINVNYVAFTRQICSGKYIHHDPQEYAEFVLATYLHLKEKYGVVPDSWEVILEPDNVPQWNGTLIGQSIVAAATRLKDHGFSPHFVAPSNTSMAGAANYFREMLTIPDALPFLDEVSYHRYRDVSAATLQTIVDSATQHGKQLSMLEWWSSKNSYEILHEDLKQGNNSAWEWGAIAGRGPTDMYNIDDSDPARPQVTLSYPTKFVRQYFKFVRARAVRIEATSNSKVFDPIAFMNSDGKFVVVVKAGTVGSFTIQGLPSGTYGIKYTTSLQYNIDLADVTIRAGQALAASIPGRGVITVYGKMGNKS